MKILPIDSKNTHYTFRTTIDDIPLVIRIDYNSRAATWYMEIYDELESLLMGSRALVVGYNIFKNVDTENLPNGDIIVMNFLSTYTDPTLTSLGEDVKIIFISEEKANA